MRVVAFVVRKEYEGKRCTNLTLQILLCEPMAQALESTTQPQNS